MGSALNDDKTDLSDTARIWQRELERAGVTMLDIQNGFDGMAAKLVSDVQSGGQSWVPDVFEFTALCLRKKTMDRVPALDEIIRILVFLPSDGNLATRYRHPLALAVAREVDMHFLKTAKAVDARRLVKPVYDRFAMQGWPEFPPEAYAEEETKALPKLADKGAARKHFENVRAILR